MLVYVLAIIISTIYICIITGVLLLLLLLLLLFYCIHYTIVPRSISYSVQESCVVCSKVCLNEEETIKQAGTRVSLIILANN